MTEVHREEEPLGSHWIGNLYALVDICVDGTNYKAGEKILNATKGHREPMLRHGQAEVRDRMADISAATAVVPNVDQPVESETKGEAAMTEPVAHEPKGMPKREKKSRLPKEA